MYWILIVDDEYLIRKGLRYSIPWEELGFKVESEAESAEEALNKLENLHIDVVITDIKMPGKNGLDLISAIKHKFPHIKTVIISGFDDFNYSVTAMKLEVHDYILKPINKNDIMNTFASLKEKLDSEHQRHGILEARENAANKLFFQRLINNNFLNQEELLEFVNKHGITYPSEACCVILLRFRQMVPLVKDRFSGSRNKLEEALDNMLRDINRELGMEQASSFSVVTGDNYSVLSTISAAEVMARHIREAVCKLTTNFVIGISQANDIGFMSVSFLQAIEAANSCSTEMEICSFSVDADKKQMDISRKVYLGKLVIQKIDEGKFEELESDIDMIFKEFTGTDLNVVFNWCINSIYDIIDYFSINSLSTKKIISDFDIMHITADFSLKAIEASYREKLNKVKDLMKSLHASSAEIVVRKACEIANAEYLNPELSLQNISSRLCISYGYLSAVFKQITGENFSVYLTNLKMNHARKLILEGNSKIYEIAELVGYSSARYFTDQFRKQFGVSPSDYRAGYVENKELGN